MMNKELLLRIALLAILSVAAGFIFSKVFASPISEKVVLEDKNRAIFDRVYSAVKDKADLPMPELVVTIAQQFLGTPYVAGTLEETPEQLRVFLDKTDCILFVEMCSCFALTVKSDKPSYELLCDNIRNMRYRGGKVEDYASRIHYTSEWILQNTANGVLREYTKELGEQYEQQFFFMTAHRDRYKQLEDSTQFLKIQAVEQYLNKQTPYYFISQERLRKPDIISQIHSGDIVCFVSKPGNGIDIAHVAIAYEVDGEMHFIHASYGAKQVIIEPKTLADYATNGIRVCRFK